MSYRVHIRSLNRRANYCTCPDFATNQLGTCKHIEAVLHQIANRRDYAGSRTSRRRRPSSGWTGRSDPAPQIRLHRAGGSDEALARLLDDHFDATGAFKRRLPEDFLRLADALAGRSDIDLGEDAARLRPPPGGERRPAAAGTGDRRAHPRLRWAPAGGERPALPLSG